MTNNTDALFDDLRDAINDLYACGDISHSGDAARARNEAIATLGQIESAMDDAYARGLDDGRGY